MADGTIDRLSIEVGGRADEAVRGISSLVGVLDKLGRGTSSGVDGLAELAGLLERMKAGSKDANFSNLTALSNLKVPAGLGASLRDVAEGLVAVPADASSKIGSLYALRDLGSVKVSPTLGTNLKSLSDALQYFPAESASRLTSLSSLSFLANLSIKRSFVTNLADLGQAMAQFPEVDASRFVAAAAALAPLAHLKEMNIRGAVRQLKELPEVFALYEGMNLTGFISQVQLLNAHLAPLATNISQLGVAFKGLPTSMRTAGAAARSVAASNKYLAATQSSVSKSTFDLMGKVAALSTFLYKAKNVIAECLDESNSYIENMNLFQAAMGGGTEAATEFGLKCQALLGIDFGEWARNQGVFQTLITGMGTTSEKATVMSQQLTQLGYDIASFYNISTSEAMTKIQSGVAGELEPLRRLGWDLSNARMNLELAKMGIDANAESMTQAEKVALRYYLIMNQVTITHGDMARTIASPANQLRVLKAQVTLASRAIGNVFIPVLNMILPVAIAAVKALRLLAIEIASLLNLDATFEVDYSSLDTSGIASVTDEAGDAAGALDDATKAAKEYKNTVMGFDEINKLNAPTESSKKNTSNGSGIGLDLPIDTYDFLAGLDDEISKRTDRMAQEMIDSLKAVLPYVTTIGAAFAAWKISSALLDSLKAIGDVAGNRIALPVLGFVTLLSDMSEFARYFRDFLDNGPTFTNVVGMLSEFSGMLGDCFLMLGNLKVAGALKVVQGVGELVANVADIGANGVNWDNVTGAVRGLTNVAIGVSLLTGKVKAAAWFVAVQGLTTVVRELGKNWDAIKQGDWSGVDKVALVIGGLETLGGLAVALDVFASLKGVKDASKAVQPVKEMTETVESIGTAVGGTGGKGRGLSSTLGNLARSLGIGIVIIGEVAIAAGLFVGAIAVIGYELQMVADAWGPVLDKGDRVLQAVLIGTGILAAVAIAVGLIGAGGVPLAVSIGIGTVVLAEMGVATGLFLLEIWAIGKGLDEIGKAWEPVLANGEDIALAVGVGTALLVGVSAAVAAIGVATIASGLLLPAAIAVGAGVLAEMGGAVVILMGSLKGVADELTNNLAPSLANLNPILPKLRDDAQAFSDGMGDLADVIGDYTASTGSMTWDSLAEGFFSLFNENPIRRFADKVGGIKDDAVYLNARLSAANAELSEATELLRTYGRLLDKLNYLSSNAKVTLAADLYVNLRECGEKIVLGFSNGMAAHISLVRTQVVEIETLLYSGFSSTMVRVESVWSLTFDSMGREFLSFASGTTIRYTVFSNDLQGGMRSTSSILYGIWVGLWSSLPGVVSASFENVFFFVERGISRVASSLARFSRLMDSIFGGNGSSSGSISVNINMPRTRYYASGGLVPSGQLFVAREAGPEMVGTLGGHTAVANNDQIVEGIEAGVMRAMLKVMSFGGSRETSGGPVSLVVKCGEAELGRAVYKSFKDLSRKGEIDMQVI